MITQYNKITPEHRNVVRSIETKSHVSYIRYLLLKRWPYDRLRRELMRLGLTCPEKEDLVIYFLEVLSPKIKDCKLGKYYTKYQQDLDDSILFYSSTFKNSETDRVSFIDLLNLFEVTQFFAEEIAEHYGSYTEIPTHPTTGEPLIPKEKPVDLVEILQNPKRHVIESLLLEGYSPKQISDHLSMRFDMELSANEIKTYAKSFFDVKRQDIQRLLDSLHSEKENLENQLHEIKRRPKSDFSFGERFELISVTKEKLEQLNKNISKLSNIHTSAAFNSAVLEVSDMREIFSDIMVRAHKRFRDMDERTEDDVVAPLNNLVNMMAKATDKILTVNEILSQTATKSVNEEMLEIIQPTLERIEREEKEAMYAYKKTYEGDSEDMESEEEIDIIGYD